jgi:hypothetical protein
VTTLAQLAAPLTPPADSPAGLLGWALAVVLGGLLVLFGLREKDRRDERTRLQTELERERAERARERVEAKEVLERLGRRYDEAQVQLTEHSRRTAMAMARRSGPDAFRDPEQWREMPTGVRDMLELVAQAMAPPVDPFADLQEWTPSRSDPPKPPRPRLPSRPR